MVVNQLTSHFYVLLTVIFTVYSQLISKWQVNSAGSLPIGLADKFGFLLRLLLNPWVISSFTCAFLAALAWMAAMTKLPLSYAYPLFISSTFVLVFFCSFLFLKEPITAPKMIGMVVIIAGIIIGSQG